MKIKGSLLMSVPIISGFGGKIWLVHATCKLGVADDPIFGNPNPIWIFTGSRDMKISRRRRSHIWNPGPRFAYSLYNFHGATMKTKGSLLTSDSIISGFGGKIWLRHVTCKSGVTDDPIFGIHDPDLPIDYTTFMGLQ